MTPPAAPAVPAARPSAPPRLGLLVVAVAVTVTAWASAFIAIRALGDAFDPGALALERLGVGALALGAALAWRRRWVRPTPREWVLVVVCALAWFGVYNVALNAAEQRLDAGTAAMLVTVGPVLIALLAGALLGEGFARWLLIGAAVALAGAGLIGAATTQSRAADGTGVALCLLAALAWAVGVTAQKIALRRLGALQVTTMACAIGALATAPFAASLAADTTSATAGELAAVVYLGLVPTALAFATWAYALSRMDAGRLGVTTYLVPPLAVLGAWPLLGEVPPALALAGGALALAGVAISRRR